MPQVRTLDGTYLVGRIRPAGWEGEVPDGPELDSALQHGLVELVPVERAADAPAPAGPVPLPDPRKGKGKF